MDVEKKGIKETKELFKGLASVAKTAKDVAADGKVDFSDLKHVVKLAENSASIVEAVKDIKEVPAEVKDLDKEELLELIGIIYAEIA